MRTNRNLFGDGPTRYVSERVSPVKRKPIPVRKTRRRAGMVERVKRGRDYRERRRVVNSAMQSPAGREVMGMLARGLCDPHRARKCAQRLLSDYTVVELGNVLYNRCRRVLDPVSDPILRRVRPVGKPGAMSEAERREYENVMCIVKAKEVVEGDRSQSG